MEEWAYHMYRRRSNGWRNDLPAKIHTNIMFGSGEQLTKRFALKNNITHVINCAFDQDSPEWFRTSSPNKYHCMNAVDSLEADITEKFEEFEKVMNKFIREPDSAMIYVHCQCGINRSGFLALLYGCKKFGYSYDDMVTSILKQRPCALTNPTFKYQCFQFVETLRTNK
jgi:protein-tyrosine phosphatase